MLLDSQRAASRLESPDNLVNRLVLKSNSNVTVLPKARIGGARGPRLPSFVRTQVAIMTRSGAAKGTEAAAAIGISSQHANDIKNGNIEGVDEEAVDRALGEVRDRALERLMASMNLITDDKLEKCKATDLSVISANMSRIVEKTLPKQNEGTQMNLIVYAPQLKSEESYKVVDVG